jgi:hypothetical protein
MFRWRTIVAVATLAMVLVACQGPSGDQTRKLIGAVILNDPGAERTATECSGSGQYTDITGGLEVTITDETGEVIGSTGLAVDARGGEGQCLYLWEVMVGPASSYSIEVGDRPAGTYTVADLNQRNWGVAVTFGEP